MQRGEPLTDPREPEPADVRLGPALQNPVERRVIAAFRVSWDDAEYHELRADLEAGVTKGVDLAGRLDVRHSPHREAAVNCAPVDAVVRLAAGPAFGPVGVELFDGREF